ncbi:MAG: class I SAM-dependent methyltransferase [Bacteroidota bacterium]
MHSSTHNEQTWDELSRQGVLCSQPRLHLTPEAAWEYLNRHGWYAPKQEGKKVLCLASGGGQQSIAFALLGADVTVVDFSAEQLEKDRLVAAEYQQSIQVIKSDMRDLSFAADAQFDIIYQPYSINYIRSVEQVFDEVVRVLKPGGIYDLMFHNPFVHGSWKDGCWVREWKPEELWRGKGYPVWQPYQDGQTIETDDPHWNFANTQDEAIQVRSPQEYRHTLSTILNGLIGRGMMIEKLLEETGSATSAKPGTWEHYQSVAPPWLYLLARKAPVG